MNLLQSPWCVIGGGFENSIETNAEVSVIAGGADNIIQAGFGYSTIGGGADNIVSAGGATIPGGTSAKASHFGQLAYASGAFAAEGDAQSSLYVLRRSTSDGTTNELFLDNTSYRLTIPSSTTWLFEAWIAARSSANKSAGYYTRGVLHNNSGTTTWVADPNPVTPVATNVFAWGATVEAAAGSTNALVIKVHGAAATDIRWVATVRTTEVSY